MNSRFSLRLLHQGDSAKSEKSELDQVLSAAAREFGQVSHSIWVLEDGLEG